MEWIDAKKQKPKGGVNVLCSDGKDVFEGYLDGFFSSYIWTRYNEVTQGYYGEPEYVETMLVTHWMPLPKPPKK